MSQKTSPKHMSFLSKKKDMLKTFDGKDIDVWELNVGSDDSILSAWAKHFREHYCLDSEIDTLKDGCASSRKEYLENFVFPDKKQYPGPLTRSGDFTEILIADYVEYIMNFWVPRWKYDLRDHRNFSGKGSDIIGFKINETDVKKNELIVFEAKGKLALSKSKENKLQEAIDHSNKDEFRLAVTLNALKKRLLKENKKEYERIVYFQDPLSNHYTKMSGAAVVLTQECFKKQDIEKATTKKHKNRDNLILVLIRGKDLMNLVHSLYERASNEA